MNMNFIILLTSIIAAVTSSDQRFLDSVVYKEPDVPKGPLYTRTVEDGPEFSI